MDVCIGMQRLPLIIVYVFLACHLSSMSSLPTQSRLECDRIFRFAPCTPHHNHLDYLHLTTGAHFLCLESIAYHRLEGFECLLPSIVQASPFYSTKFSRIWPTMKFSLTSSPALWSNVSCLFVDKRHQTIATSLWLKSKILHSNHSKNFLKIQSLVYYKDPFNSTKNLCSMTYLYFSKPVPCFFVKASSIYVIVCSIKNVMTISWNFHVAIHLGSLSLNF